MNGDLCCLSRLITPALAFAAPPGSQLHATTLMTCVNVAWQYMGCQNIINAQHKHTENFLPRIRWTSLANVVPLISSAKNGPRADLFSRNVHSDHFA